MKARMLYSGSHSTSCLPRGDMAKKNRNKEKDEKNLKDEKNAKEEKNEKDEMIQEPTVSSFLSFLEQPPSEIMRKHLNLGTSEDKMRSKPIETFTTLSSENDKNVENLRAHSDENKVKIKVVGKFHIKFWTSNI